MTRIDRKTMVIFNVNHWNLQKNDKNISILSNFNNENLLNSFLNGKNLQEFF